MEGLHTTVVPFYGIRYAAPHVSTDQRWCVGLAYPCMCQRGEG